MQYDTDSSDSIIRYLKRVACKFVASHDNIIYLNSSGLDFIRQSAS